MTRQMLTSLVVGSQCSLPLIVKNVTAKLTRAGKQYLSFEFFDGQDTITANYWDWNGKTAPTVNTVLTVVGIVDEYMGKKQINVKALKNNTEFSTIDFMPASSHDLGTVYKDAYELLSDVRNDTLRSIGLGLLEDEAALWLSVPSANFVHHAYVGGTLVHCLSVAKTAKAIASVTNGADVDLCVVGGMLHDIGKLFAYAVDGVAIKMTDIGILMEHTFLGARRIDDWAGVNLHLEPNVAATLELLLHIVLSHHGKQEYGAATPPLSLEAHIVSHADGIDATAEQIRDASKDATMWTDKIWALNNKTHLSVNYVQSITKESTEE